MTGTIEVAPRDWDAALAELNAGETIELWGVDPAEVYRLLARAPAQPAPCEDASPCEAHWIARFTGVSGRPTNCVFRQRRLACLPPFRLEPPDVLKVGWCMRRLRG